MYLLKNKYHCYINGAIPLTTIAVLALINQQRACHCAISIGSTEGEETSFVTKHQFPGALCVLHSTSCTVTLKV